MAAITPRSTTSDPRLRIALTLPGGISPGTFEAGAVCALLSWMQEVNAREEGAVAIDVISGASAGALTGLLSARVILAGDDPIPAFRWAWIAAPSLRALQGTGPWAPLSLRRAKAVADTLIFAPSPVDSPLGQPTPIRLDIALASLRGFTYDIPQGLNPGLAGSPVPGTSYLDWSQHLLRQLPPGSTPQGSDEDDWREAVDSVIASASDPLGFSARRLDREPQRARYTAAGVKNLPDASESLRLWYSDGGLLDNEPLARCLRTVAALDGAPTPARLVVLVRSSTRQSPAAESPAWAGSTHPRFTETLVRALDLITAHALAADLEQVNKMNARLRWTKDVAVAIGGLLTDDRRAQELLAPLLTQIQAESQQLRRPDGLPLPPASPGSRTSAQLVEALLRAASGLDSKQPADLAVITPDPDYPAPPPNRDLVGFVQRGQREAFFTSGYWTTLGWMRNGGQLEERLSPQLANDARIAVERRLRKPRETVGRRSGELPLRLRLETLRLGGRAAMIAAGDLLAARRTRRHLPGA